MDIHTAAKAGNLEALKQFHANGVDLNGKDKHSNSTPLMHAANSSNANTEMIQYLIAAGADINATGGETGYGTALSTALNKGHLETTRLLLDLGADVNYTTPDGYCALLDVMFGRYIARDKNLVSLVKLLMDRGASLDGESSYGESAIAVASRNGRFDVVKLLLAAGADPEPLKWTALMHAIALGCLDEVKKQLEDDPDREIQDSSKRTPWLLSLQTGDIEKAKLLLPKHVKPDSSIFYTITNDHAPVLSWLLSQGYEPDLQDDFSSTPLMVASEEGAVECIKVLIRAGVDIHKTNQFDDAAIKMANSSEVVNLLVNAGANLGDVNEEMHQELIVGAANDTPVDDELPISSEAYHAGRTRQFAQQNPQIMEISFWKAMVRTGMSAWEAQEALGEGLDDDFDDDLEDDLEDDLNIPDYDSYEIDLDLEALDDEVLDNLDDEEEEKEEEESYDPDDPELISEVRDTENLDTDSLYLNFQEEEPVWTFQRFGKSITVMPDGRYIEIGGEHEDWYDEDFCIYNDVVVLNGKGSITIYGYPSEAFPPTDFHTATQVGEYIYIIGGLGYPEARYYGETPVYRLHSETFHIEKLVTSGQNPGWIHRHATVKQGNALYVSGGKIIKLIEGEEQTFSNQNSYVFNLDDLSWELVHHPV